MNKGNIIRIIFWFLLCILSIAATITGMIKYQEGYGKYGSIRKTLLPVVEKFNNKYDVKKNNATIKAKIKKDKILVSFVDDYTDITHKFVYSKTADLELLTLEYETVYSTSAQAVASYMIDAVSMANGNVEGAVFSKYEYGNFYDTTTIQGVHLSSTGTKNKLEININANIIENLEDVVLTPLGIKYITKDDIINLKTELKKKKEYEYAKLTTKLYIIEEEKTYTIYCTDNAGLSTIYESMMSAVSMLNEDVYDNIIKSKNKLVEEYKGDGFMVNVSDNLLKEKIPFEYNRIVKLIIEKKKDQ